MTCLEHVRGSTCSVFSETNAVPMMADTDMVSVPCDRTDPNECLKLLPKKSILKVKKPLFEDVPPCKRNSIGDGRAHFDEMNILATHHPAEKDYGHMKIEEPKTPFHHYSDSEPEEGVSSSQQRQRRVSLVTGVDAENLVEALEKNTAPVLVPGESDEPAEELESLSPEQIKHKQDFEKKRRAHYNEGAVLKAAKDQMCSDEDDEE